MESRRQQNFSRYYPKRLNAEVLLDAIDQVTGTNSNFGQVPMGTRAVQLPDNGFNSYFLTVLSASRNRAVRANRALVGSEPGTKPALAELGRNPGQVDRW